MYRLLWFKIKYNVLQEYIMSLNFEIVDKDDKFNTKKKYKVVSLAEDHEMDKVVH